MHINRVCKTSNLDILTAHFVHFRAGLGQIISEYVMTSDLLC